jgi:hypothetical protein
MLPLMLNAPASILQGTLLPLVLLCWPLRKRRCQFKNEAVIEKIGRRWRFVTAKWGDLLGQIGVWVWRSFGQNQGDRDGGGLRLGRRVVFTFFFFGRERKSSFFFYFFSLFFIYFFFSIFRLSIFLTPIFFLISAHISLYKFFFSQLFSRTLSLSLYFFFNFSFQRSFGTFFSFSRKYLYYLYYII